MKKFNTKTSLEISKIEKACNLTGSTFKYILTKIKSGITEKELSLKIQRFIKRNNAKLAFRPIVAFGKNSSEHHHKPNETKLKKGDIVLLDFGAKVDGYCSDMTRTVFMGRATAEQKRIYDTVLKSQQLAIEFIRKKCHSKLREESHIGAKDVDKVARDYIKSQGFEPMTHSLGHGIGKKVHEGFRLSPKSKHFLKPAAVFSIEPGIYLPAGKAGIKGFGGIRIEDTVVLEKKGLRTLTHSTKDIIEV